MKTKGVWKTPSSHRIFDVLGDGSERTRIIHEFLERDGIESQLAADCALILPRPSRITFHVEQPVVRSLEARDSAEHPRALGGASGPALHSRDDGPERWELQSVFNGK
jgi:hypothetical protein